MSAITNPFADESPPDVEPPSYDSIVASTPIIVTFCRFSYAHLDHKTGKRYIGRRIQSRSDMALISTSTTWEEFTRAQLVRATQHFGWDEDVVSNFAFNLVLRVGKQLIPADPTNWVAIKEMLLSRKGGVMLVISVCPSSVEKPTWMTCATCSVVKTLKSVKERLTWK